MAKDPAFLFYTQDFMVGTILMSNEQVGIYIKLLCVQHQHGGLIEKTYFNAIVGSSELIRMKFIETNDGFFNERLMEEMTKRSVKSTNLSLNAKKRWEGHAIAKPKHMPIENENEDESVVNKRTTKAFIKPSAEELKAYFLERKSELDPDEFFDFYESKGWMVGKTKMKCWKASVRNWIRKGAQFSIQKKEPFKSDDLDKMIESELGRIATKDMIKKVMSKMNPKMWWKISAFLSKRYTGGGKEYAYAEREMQEGQTAIRSLTEGIGK